MKGVNPQLQAIDLKYTLILYLVSLVHAGFAQTDAGDLLEPSSLVFVQEFETREERNSHAPQSYHFLFNDIAIYQRNDSTLFNYLNKGTYQEFIAPTALNMVFFEDRITDFEFIGQEAGETLLLFKLSRFENRSSSAWSVWYRNQEMWVVIDLENSAVVFDFVVSEVYNEESYSSDGDIYDESLSDEEMSKIYESRQTSVSECGFSLEIEIQDNLGLEIRHEFPPYDNTDFCESSLIEAGDYTWTGERFLKKD